MEDNPYTDTCTCKETWKRLKIRPYEISSRGRIRRIGTGRILRPVINPPKEYLRVTLYGFGRKSKKHVYIHILTAIYHVDGKGPFKNTVDHVDGDKYNCCSCNLEWVTIEENVRRKNERLGYNCNAVITDKCPF